MAESIALDKKIGPLPIGAWILVVGAGLALGYFMNKRKSSDLEGGQSGEAGVGEGGSGWDVVPPPSSDVVPEELTNMTWALKAQTYLIAQGYPATEAVNAINKYIYSMDLTLEEKALVDLVLKKYGPPPEPLAPITVPKSPPPTPTGIHAVTKLPSGDGITFAWTASAGAKGYRMRSDDASQWWESAGGLPTMFYGGLRGGRTYTFQLVAYNDNGESAPAVFTESTLPTPFTPPPPAPAPNPQNPAPSTPAQRTWTVDPGDTLWGISLAMYANANRWQEIYNANAGVIESTARAHGYSNSQNGKWIFPGTVLVIP